MSQGTSKGEDPPVFIFIFDGLGRDLLFKNGEIDPARFPNFAALGRDSAVFANATSNYDTTFISIGSMLTGQWTSLEELTGNPCVDVTRMCQDSVLRNLADSGYVIEFFQNNPCVGGGLVCQETASVARKYPFLYLEEATSLLKDKLIPERLLSKLPRSIRERVSLFIPPSSLHIYTLALWDDFVDSVTADSSMGRVYYVHLFLPHAPYEFTVDGRLRPVPDASQMERAYEEQTMFLDKLFGRFLTKLRAEGLYGSAFIVATADHGPRTLGRPLSRDSGELNGVIPNIPLIIHGPGVGPGVLPVDY